MNGVGRWVPPALLLAVIYASLPVGPVVWRWLQARFPAPSWGLTVLGLVAGAAWLAWRHRRRLAAVDRVEAAALAALALAYAAALGALPLVPAEQTHLVSYGALALLVWRALDRRRRPLRRGVIAVAVVAAAGLVDEGIQYLLPDRYFEWRDVGLNALSGFLPVAVAVFLEARQGRRPSGGGPAPGPVGEP